MLKRIFLLSIIYSISMFYNYLIHNYILIYISNTIYHNIIISLLILVQIDNFILFFDYNKIKLDLDNLIKENKKIIIFKQPYKYINKKLFIQ
jgi:hypothetical protein